jgi:hypothetical protein
MTSYYQPNYMDSPEFQWDENMQPYYMNQYYTPHQQYIGCEQKGVRKRNPEREEDKAKFMISLENIFQKLDSRTTLMIKNIPNKYSQVMLLKKIDENHKRFYDFFYLPIDFKVFLHMK